MFKQLIKFLGVGAIATALQYAILIALTEAQLMSAVPASNTGFAISAVLNYWLNHVYTFASTEKHRVAAPKFALVALTGLLLNHLIMHTLVEQLALYYLLAQVLTTGCVLVWNFLINRIWTFKAG